jgi:hypothetical protein
LYQKGFHRRVHQHFGAASFSIQAIQRSGKIAIIDTPNNAAKVASISAQNVKVVIRYFAQKHSPVWARRSSDGNIMGGVREPTVLIRNGLSIVSLYQYRVTSPRDTNGLEDRFGESGSGG